MKKVRVNYFTNQNMNNIEKYLKIGLFKIIILTIPILANGQEKLSIDLLENFKWMNSNFDDCSRYYYFKADGHFEYWNCSMEQLDTGIFEIQNDTLMIYEYHLKSEIPENLGGEEGTEIRYQYNFILKDGFLYLVYYRDYKYNYESYESDLDFRYTRGKKLNN